MIDRRRMLKGLTLYSVEFNGKGDPTEAIKGVLKKVNDRVK